jgi:chemotaxis family two-component system response regulator Rcp1
MMSTAKSAQILLVEDNEGDALLTREALKDSKLHIELDRVCNGVEALSYLRREGEYHSADRPDLILLDLNMPKMDGRQLLDILKNDPDLKSIPVVVLTTSAAEMDIVKSYELQASCYITKPVDFDQFKIILDHLKEFWFTLVRLPEKK